MEDGAFSMILFFVFDLDSQSLIFVIGNITVAKRFRRLFPSREIFLADSIPRFP